MSVFFNIYLVLPIGLAANFRQAISNFDSLNARECVSFSLFFKGLDMSSRASQHSSSGRREDFPIDSLRYMESKLGEIRRAVMKRAASLAEAATSVDMPTYRVEPEHIDLAFSYFVDNSAVMDFRSSVQKDQITEADAAVLSELGWDRLQAGTEFIHRPTTDQGASQ